MFARMCTQRNKNDGKLSHEQRVEMDIASDVIIRTILISNFFPLFFSGFVRQSREAHLCIEERERDETDNYSMSLGRADGDHEVPVTGI